MPVRVERVAWTESETLVRIEQYHPKTVCKAQLCLLLKRTRNTSSSSSNNAQVFTGALWARSIVDFGTSDWLLNPLAL